ncbi:MAG: hypothetical protein ACKVP2_05795 [Burkholderiales bacterium]
MKRIPAAVAAMVALLFTLPPAYAQQASGILDAVKSGQPELSFRPRYEWADDDAFAQDARGLTLRTLAGWRTLPYRGFEGRVLLGSSVQLIDDFNDGHNGKTQYPFSNTPEETDFTEAYVRWRGVDGLAVTAGRQKLDLDRTRFVGPNEFRQTQRWYNGASATIDRLPAWNFFLAHFVRERGPDTRQRELRLEVARASYEWTAGHTLLGSAYLHDQARAIPGTSFADLSYRILSLRADGRVPLDTRRTLIYTAEYGEQRPYADGDDRIRAPYTRVALGGTWTDFRFSANYERLGSNSGIYGMQTPLGLLHPSQGWADKFNITPLKGVRDGWVTAGYKFGKWDFYTEVHRFGSDVGDIDYGREVDLRLDWNMRRNLQMRTELADFRAADDPGNVLTNATRLWMTVFWAIY